MYCVLCTRLCLCPLIGHAMSPHSSDFGKATRNFGGGSRNFGKVLSVCGENITHTRYAIIMTMFRFMIIENSDNNYSGSVLPVCSIEHRSNDENYSSINYGMVAIIIINN